MNLAGHWNWARLEAFLLTIVLMELANSPLPTVALKHDTLI